MERKALKDQQCGTGENVMSIAEALVQYQYGHMEDLDPRGEVPLGPLLQTKNGIHCYLSYHVKLLPLD